MPTTKNRDCDLLIPPPAPDYARAFVGRAADLDWTVKRYVDGELITKSADRLEAVRLAEELGFSIY